MTLAPEGYLRVHRAMGGVTVLGPARRFVVWTQGCARRCVGCETPDAQAMTGGQLVRADALAARALGDYAAEGLTISGGEPFLQAAALAAMIDIVRAARDMGVIVYTGFTLAELRADPDAGVQALLARVDLLIDGPYVEALNDDGALRGSSNQCCVFLTPRYLPFADAYGAPSARALQPRFDEEGLFVAGILPRDARGWFARGEEPRGGV